jgi:N-acetylglucosamine kinase-like BadF-type ATPase
MSSDRAAVLAIDSGATKIDAALVGADGRVIAAIRGRGTSFSPEDHDRSVEALLRVLRELAGATDGAHPGPLAEVGAFCIAGDDLPTDDRRLTRAMRDLGVTGDVIVHNDTFAVLRAGTDRQWGVGVVCGTGINCSAVAPNGRTVRFASLGQISGDEGGGGWMGEMALATAVRSRDGRGPKSMLEQAVPDHFGMRAPLAVTEAIHTGRLEKRRLTQLPPLVMHCAAEGDAPSLALVEHLADEVAGMVGSAVRRLRMTRLDVDVALGGGILRSGDPLFMKRVSAGILSVAPKARMRPLTGPPVVGAALLGLDRLGVSDGAYAKVREALTDERLAGDGRV